MKKYPALILMALILLMGTSLAEEKDSARAYALWLEEMLPEYSFADAETPEYCGEMLGTDYEYIARSAPSFGSYIAAVRDGGAAPLRKRPCGIQRRFRGKRALDGEGRRGGSLRFLHRQ